ncbi:unnamed protein product [Urochloa decumbens]|uniref:Uncharacterized protein n=1 Tax=Urochloa decumbens TaxID=240449 RepID=A0ABC8ZPB4_9POAL
MASIVLLLSELLGGESASVLAADRYILGGHLISRPREFWPAVTEEEEASTTTKQNERQAAATGREQKRNEESFEDLAASRIEVDVMWP